MIDLPIIVGIAGVGIRKMILSENGLSIHIIKYVKFHTFFYIGTIIIILTDIHFLLLLLR